MTEKVRETLTARQEKVLATLLVAPSLESAAQTAGISPRTLYRWIHEDPLFEVEYRSARRQAIDGAIASLQLAASDSVEALRSALTDRNVSNRIRAASILLDNALKAHEAFDLAERVKELERSSGEGYASW